MRRGRGLRRLATALPFIGPSLIGVVLFLLVPVVIVLVLSFFQWNFLSPPHWVGFANFGKMTRDYHVFHALETTAFYVLWNIPIQTVIALGLAMLLNRRLPGMGFFRALYVLPYMATPVAMAVVWGWVFNSQYGLINHLPRGGPSGRQSRASGKCSRGQACEEEGTLQRHAAGPRRTLIFN